MQITANNPKLKSWIPVPKDSDFPIQNIPFGVFITKEDIVTIGTRIGNTVIDLGALQQSGYFKGIKLSDDVFLQDTLNDFISHGRKRWREVRNRIAEIFNEDNIELQNNSKQKEVILFDIEDVEMLLPVEIGDYTDFFSGIHHAENVGKLFYGKDNQLPQNWKHMPICFSGRSSSVVVSGTPIKRPKGQLYTDSISIGFSNTKQLDFELEIGFITTDGCHLGQPISIQETEEHIFGLVLLNDWTARDFQKWELNPLGPYVSKNFATSISPWIVTMDALEPFRMKGPEQKPQPLPYLSKEGKHAYDIKLFASISTENSPEKILCQTNFKDHYWTMNQQLAHHSSNGCNIRSGDLFGSGSISSKEMDGFSSLIEISQNGTKTFSLENGSLRMYLEDYDTVTFRGYCENENVRIGFGECIGKILP